MKHFAKFGLILMAVSFCFGGLQVLAQDKLVPQAHVPSQLPAAKTVFISNSTVGLGTESDEAFEMFYAKVDALKRFSIVAEPAKADLILEQGASAIPSFSFSLKPTAYGFYVTLRIRDVKTHAILWSMSEHADAAILHANLRKDAEAAFERLAADLQRVCTPVASSPTATGK